MLVYSNNATFLADSERRISYQAQAVERFAKENGLEIIVNKTVRVEITQNDSINAHIQKRRSLSLRCPSQINIKEHQMFLAIFDTTKKSIIL